MTWSCFQPGSDSQFIGTQRERACSMGAEVGRSGGASGATAQETSVPRMAAEPAARSMRDSAGRRNRYDMWVILLEALGALLIFVFIIWWTMFSGRRGGERIDDEAGPGERDE